MVTLIPKSELTALRQIALQGSQHAAEALSFFSGGTLTVNGANASIIPIEDVPSLLRDPEEVVVGINFMICGDIEGYLLAFFHLPDAMSLVATLTGEPPPDTIEEFGEMELSALGETGNIIVSSFLAPLEPLCGLNAEPSPPMVAVEMCSAILTSAVLPIAEAGGDLLLMEADITPGEDQDGQSASCRVLFLPTPTSWQILHQAFAAHHDEC